MKFFSQGLRSCSTLKRLSQLDGKFMDFLISFTNDSFLPPIYKKYFTFSLFNVYLCRYRGWRMKKWIVRIGLSMFLGVCHTNRLNIITKYAFWLPIYATWVLISPQRSLCYLKINGALPIPWGRSHTHSNKPQEVNKHFLITSVLQTPICCHFLMS